MRVGRLEEDFGRHDIIPEEGEFLLHKVQLADEQLLLHVEILDEFGGVVGGVNSCGLGFLLGLGEVELGGGFPVQSFVVVVLLEEGEEVGDAQDESVIVDEGLGGELLVDLVLSSGDELNVVDGEGWDQRGEHFEMLVLFGYDFAESLHHQVQVVDLLAETVFEGAQQLIQLLAGHSRDVSQS